MRFLPADRLPRLPRRRDGSPAVRAEALASRLAGGMVRTAPALVLGLAAAALALAGSRAEPKYVIAGAGGLVFLAALLLFPDARRTSHVLLALFALSIPFNLQKTWLYRPHVGGAVGITVALGDVALCGLALVWLYQNAARGTRYLTRIHPPLVGAWLCFIGAGILSLLHAAHPSLVLFELIRLTKLLFVMIVIMNLEAEDVGVFLRWIAVGVLIESGFAFMQFALKKNLGLRLFGEERLVRQDIGSTVSRASGTIGHPNALGYYFEMLIPLMLALFLAARTRGARLLYGAAAALGLTGIIMTLSRGAWIGLPVSLSLVVAGMRREIRWSWGALRVAAGAGLLAAVLLGFFLPTVQKRLTHTDYMSAQSRLPLNRAAFSLVEQYPVFGVGLNNFSEVFKSYDRTGYSRRFSGYRHVVHNLYLLIWAEVGTVGFAAFLALFAAGLTAAARAAAHAPPLRRAILVGIASGLIAHLLHGLFDPGFKVSFSISALVFSLLGLIGCMRLEERRERRRAAATTA